MDPDFVEAGVESAPSEIDDRLGFLGFWDCNFQTGMVKASEDIDRLFGLARQDGRPLPIAVYALRVHPQDVEWVGRGRVSSVGPSGHGVIEFRVLDGNDKVHWIMCRGHYQTDDHGNLLTGRGLMIDITGFKADENTIRTAPTLLVYPLHHVVDLTIAAFEAAKQVGNHELSSALKASLIIAARQLAVDATSDVTAKQTAH